MSEKKKTMTAEADHRYSTRCRTAPYFPKEVIFNILIFVPANFLHEVARYVCKQWYDIVSDPLFVRTHREMSTPGFLVQDDVELHQVYHVEIVDSGATKLNETEFSIPVSAMSPKILCCLNGLVLLTDLTDREILYVPNPATNLKISLPPLAGLSTGFEIAAGLAVDSSGHYKAVHVSGRRIFSVTDQVQMRVFTIGVDKTWRFLDLEGIPVNLESRESMLLCPYCLAGFIYWFTYNKANSFGLAIDVDTETLYQFSHPQGVSRIEDRGKHQVFVPCKTSKKERNILSLPRDIIFNILILIPASVLHQVVRYVCKQWNDILNDPRFIKTQCQSSSACLLIQTMTQQHNVYYIEGDVLTQVAFPNTGRIYGSCNGLVLFQNFSYPQILSVINPVTKVKISLPPLHWLGTLISSIGFAITSCGHYKVMAKLPGEEHRPKIQVMVFTIGVDKAWRLIHLQINSIMDRNILCPPLFIAGMMYWYYSNPTCYALDVDTETIYQFSKPDNVSVQLLRRTKFLNLGVCLGFIQEDEGKWRLWKLTDVKSCVWTELAGINVTVILSTLSKNLIPLKYISCMPTMLIDDMLWFDFDVGGGESIVIRFNLANESYVIFTVKRVPPVIGSFHHVHTLVSPKKCYF